MGHGWSTRNVAKRNLQGHWKPCKSACQGCWNASRVGQSPWLGPEHVGHLITQTSRVASDLLHGTVLRTQDNLLIKDHVPSLALFSSLPKSFQASSPFNTLRTGPERQQGQNWPLILTYHLSKSQAQEHSPNSCWRGKWINKGIKFIWMTSWKFPRNHR